jgi:hypothetical protein
MKFDNRLSDKKKFGMFVGGFGKRAQITIFIIIGIIILLSTGVYLYVREAGVGLPTILQPKTAPIETFITLCLERTARDALNLIGAQGGFLTLPPAILYNPTRYVDAIPGIGGGLDGPKIPYWYYEGKTQYPHYSYIQREVELYIEQNIGSCIDDFRAFKDEFDIVERSNVTATVLLNEEDTVASIDYAIDVMPKGSEEVTRKDKFIVVMKVKVKKMWRLAGDILKAENENMDFERMTLNFMALHPPSEIPFSGLTFQCGRMLWSVIDIKQKLERDMQGVVAGVRFRQTDHPPFLAPDDEYEKFRGFLAGDVLPKQLPPPDAYDYFQYYFPIGSDNEYPDLIAGAQFKKEWGIRLKVTPSDGVRMQSGVADLKSKILSFLCMNQYHFVYDVTFPVVISVRDPDAFNGQGFVFRYAFPVNIFHNRGNRDITPAVYFEPVDRVGDYCEVTSGPVREIIVRDKIFRNELSGVELNFNCFTQNCKLGTTKTNNRHLQWSGQLPEGCTGAFIIANKSGYLEAKDQIYAQNPFDMELYPTVPVTFSVRRHQENSPNVARFLGPDEWAIVNINLDDPELSIYTKFGADQNFNNTKTFELVRANKASYEVTVMLLKTVGGEDMLTGGWIGTWNVTSDELEDAKEVRFHAMQSYPIPDPADTMALVATYELMTNTTGYPDIRPEIIRQDSDEEEEVGFFSIGEE